MVLKEYLKLFLDKNLNPDNSIIVFDLNGVVLDLNKTEFYSKLLKLITFRRTYRFLTSGVLFDIYTKWRANCKCGEEYYKLISQKYPQLNLTMKNLIELDSCQNLNFQVVEIIKNLKEKGYKVWVFTNMGIDCYNSIYQKYPEVFKLFDGVQACTEKDNYVCKPNKNAFDLFLKRINSVYQDQRKIIFIDDRKKNIEASNQYNQILGIQFGNAENLKLDLKRIIKN